MKKVDVSLTFPLPLATRFLEEQGLTTFTWEKSTRPSPVELREMANNSRAMITMLTDKVDENMFRESQSLKVIANNAVGFNNISVDDCKRNKISVCNTPDVLTDATADIALGLMIDCARRMSHASIDMRAGNWKGWNPRSFIGLSLKNKTLGIVGMGRIGEAVMKRARGAFDMEILFTSRSSKKIEGATQVELAELLKRSDFVSLHCPLSDQTKNLISKNELALMKKEAILINTARGEIVDEMALIQALKTGTIWGAGLDVYQKEPLDLSSELFNLKNVSLTPHIGSADIDTRNAMELLSAENVFNVLAGKRARGEVFFAD